MGFDKHWSQYFYHSRRVVKGLSNHIQEISGENIKNPEITIEQDILAIKELSIYSTEPDLKLSIKYEMAHYTGWFETEIPSKEFNL